MELIHTLEEIGLPEREIKIYLALLELDESTVLPIAKKAGIKRTYCYDILDDLIKRGLVNYIEKNGRRHYIAEDPKKIEQLLKDRLRHFSEVLPEIRSLYNRNTHKPKVRFFEGREAVVELFAELERVKEFASVASPVDFYPLLGQDRIDAAARAIVKKNIKARELLTWPGTPVSFQKIYKKPTQEIRYLSKAIQLSTDMFFYENKVVLISCQEPVHAISIEGSSVVKTFRVMFDLLWQATPAQTKS